MITKLRKFFARELTPFSGTKKSERTREVLEAMVECVEVLESMQHYDYCEPLSECYCGKDKALAKLRAKLEEAE